VTFNPVKSILKNSITDHLKTIDNRDKASYTFKTEYNYDYS